MRQTTETSVLPESETLGEVMENCNEEKRRRRQHVAKETLLQAATSVPGVVNVTARS